MTPAAREFLADELEAVLEDLLVDWREWSAAMLAVPSTQEGVRAVARIEGGTVAECTLRLEAAIAKARDASERASLRADVACNILAMTEPKVSLAEALAEASARAGKAAG